MMVQLLRRTVQVGAVLLIAGVAVISLYGHYRSAGVVDDDVLMAGMRGELISRAIHPLFEDLDDPQSVLDGNRGTLWSMQLLGVGITDPLAALEAFFATRSVHVPLLLSIVIPVLGTVILGKVFCSWICPGYLLFELSGKLRQVLRFAEIEPANVRFAHNNKYVFLVVGLGLAAAFSAPLFALIYPPAVLSRVIHAWIFGTALGGMVVIVAIMVVFELLVSPRWWCRTICPGGALYGLLGRWRLLRVKLADSGCTGCQACIPVCEAGINPITQSASIECDNCGVCINHCQPKVLYYTLGLPRARTRRSLPPVRTLAWVLGFVLPVAYARPLAAHHVLGLPHYSYKENYPQRPTLEYPATTGPYEVLLTAYPGIPVPGEPANLAFYIKNFTTGDVYQRPVRVRVLQTSTFGDNHIVMPATERRPFDNQHKFQCAFPIDAEYIVELTMEVEGRTEVIPFLIVAGQPTATASVVLAGAVATVLCFIVIRAVHRKRRRRRAASAAIPQAIGQGVC